jgi:putative membrane protein
MSAKTAKTIESDTKPTRKRSILKGALAGLVGGIAGSAAKMAAEAIFPPRVEGQTPPPVVLAQKAIGHPLDATERKVAVQGIHWTFGALAGAAYGAVAEVHPRAAAWRGVAFGLALKRFTHGGILPRAGLAAPVERQPMQERASEWVSHALYGAVTDTVRRGVRTGIE